MWIQPSIPLASTMKKLFCLLIACVLFYSCTPDSEKGPDVSSIEMKVKVHRLEQELFKLKSKEEINLFLKNTPLFNKQLLDPAQYPNDSAKIHALFGMIHDPYMDTLYRQTQTVFADITELEKEFEDAFKHIKYYYPNFKAPAIYTVVTGLSYDLEVSDSAIVIGLDFFLGDKRKYQPNGIPQYILRRYRPEYIVSMSLMAMSEKYNVTDPSDQTLLAEMIYYGKAYEFVKNMLPDKNDTLIIGYTNQQLVDTEANQESVWAHFIEQKLLYETKNSVKIKYTSERPYTAEIGQKCPGAIGRWLGWKIVRRYREKQESVTLPELMKTKDAKLIFNQSKYKGKS